LGCVIVRPTSLATATLKKTSWLVVPLLTLAVSPARGAEVTRVVSALDDDNRFDLNLTATWMHEVKSAFIKRELQSAMGTELIKDLKYGFTRDVINFRADFGILWDVGLHVELPLVIADQSTLEFDQSESNCVFPGGASRPTCVNAQNATILRDGILPSDGSSWGINSPNHGTGGVGDYSGQSTSVFRSPRRSGFGYLGVGVAWAAFNQLRDDTKPTWTLGFDALLDVFKDKRFDAANPVGNTAVGPGYHQFVWSTYVSKRFRYFDPYFGAWYNLPVRTNGSVFQKYSDAQTSVNPQQRAGVVIGVEQIAWENPVANQRVTIEARVRAEQHFFGRSHSELWEPLSGSSACASDMAACRPGIDGPMQPYPGVTDTEAYGSFGGDFGLNVQVGRYIRFRGLFGLTSDMPHFITAGGAGKDVTGPEDRPDNRIDSTDPREANPIYRESIDLPGRRFKVESTKLWTLFLQGSLMF
jgi:hypothetical protein